MLRYTLTFAMLLVGFSGYAAAHHSYSEFLRDKQISVEGRIEEISFANPHVIITLKTTTAETYTLEWNSIGTLRAFGVESFTLEKGQTIVATGSPRRTNAHYLALLQQLRRPSDGWNWARRSAE